MSHLVISSFENIDTGDLQAQGEAIALFASEAHAREHFATRSSAIAAGVRTARENDASATFITWIVLLRMPLEVGDADEALEDLELVIEETDSVEDPFGELVIAYEGHTHTQAGADEYPRKDALKDLQAWLT